jgi:retron-type reverse transcriptase
MDEADLHGRMKAMKYRHQPIRRVHIPKANGKTRPIGVSTTEDKIVQGALRELLEAIYEQDFLECSYGFRPGRSAHDAIQALSRSIGRGELHPGGGYRVILRQRGSSRAAGDAPGADRRQVADAA